MAGRKQGPGQGQGQESQEGARPDCLPTTKSLDGKGCHVLLLGIENDSCCGTIWIKSKTIRIKISLEPADDQSHFLATESTTLDSYHISNNENKTRERERVKESKSQRVKEAKSQRVSLPLIESSVLSLNKLDSVTQVYQNLDDDSWLTMTQIMTRTLAMNMRLVQSNYDDHSFWSRIKTSGHNATCW